MERLKTIWPEIVYVRSPRNLGFAAGNNLGIEYAHGEHLLFLNNDTEITETLITGLKRQLDADPQIGLISPLILFYDNKQCIQYAGSGAINYFTGRNKGQDYQVMDQGQHDLVTEETTYCHGAAMMCRSADLAAVGLMEEHYFLYYEELDWCEKFRRSSFKIALTGTS